MKSKPLYFLLMLAATWLLPVSRASAQDSLPPLPEGIILAHQGETVIVKWTSNPYILPKDTMFVLQKHFEKKWGNTNINGWLIIADVKVLSSDKTQAVLKIMKEQSEITVNGEKVDHFKTGNRVKVTPWKPEETESNE